MTTLGIIGSGNIGTAVARLAVAADLPVVISNSRGPRSLTGLIDELGPLATADTVEQAASADLVLLSVPLAAHTAIPAALLADKTVLDTSNYYPSRDGRIAELDNNTLTTSELVHRHLAEARLVKAFSNILFHHIPQLTRPATSPGSADRTTLPIAGDDANAKTDAAALINRLGFDTIDTGSLADSWRFEPDSAAYTRLYLADPTTPDAQLFTAPGRPVLAAELRTALQAAQRVRVADRVI
ncbi:NADPH-dependent F420 reductase [Streptomyces sp. NPDC096310]|uniref:NADPH-dependent F420 reductase n=1 Tax=Streptomyces sp. NPDC096310 TaxID=3366082 RepID=UPI0037F1A88A